MTDLARRCCVALLFIALHRVTTEEQACPAALRYVLPFVLPQLLYSLYFSLSPRPPSSVVLFGAGRSPVSIVLMNERSETREQQIMRGRAKEVAQTRASAEFNLYFELLPFHNNVDLPPPLNLIFCSCFPSLRSIIDGWPSSIILV